MGQWHSQPTCMTPACIHAASHILQNLAPHWAEMDPCTEFDKSEQQRPLGHSDSMY
jgi:endothelin-converting enzyme